DMQMTSEPLDRLELEIAAGRQAAQQTKTVDLDLEQAAGQQALLEQQRRLELEIAAGPPSHTQVRVTRIVRARRNRRHEQPQPTEATGEPTEGFTDTRLSFPSARKGRSQAKWSSSECSDNDHFASNAASRTRTTFPNARKRPPQPLSNHT